ncbi:thioredoxin-like protein [Phellopilus nigrolimitatus]|nr:thioredoxin-like protein [Phellopilus nigrolimitatus]
MFKGFLRSKPSISIFHHSSSPQSIRTLDLLRSALTSPPPSNPKAGPLEFDLEVVESAPTEDQVTTILSYLPSSPSVSSTFISSHPTSASVRSETESQVTSKTLAELAQTNPSALKWPIVVDWLGGRASVGDLDGVRGILEAILKEQKS